MSLSIVYQLISSFFFWVFGWHIFRRILAKIFIAVKKIRLRECDEIYANQPDLLFDLQPRKTPKTLIIKLLYCSNYNNYRKAFKRFHFISIFLFCSILFLKFLNLSPKKIEPKISRKLWCKHLFTIFDSFHKAYWLKPHTMKLFRYQ